MIEIRRRSGQLQSCVCAGLTLHDPYIGVKIMPVGVGAVLRGEGNSGPYRWEVVCDTEDYWTLITLVMCHDHGPEPIHGYAGVVIGEVLPADDGGWYVYGYCIGGDMAPQERMTAPRCGGFTAVPLREQLRLTVGKYLANRYADQLQAVAPHLRPDQKFARAITGEVPADSDVPGQDR